MATKHSLIAQVRVNFVPAGLVEDETVYPSLRIKFSFLRGSPASGPTWGNGGQPADPAEVEFISAELIDGDGVQPMQEQINTWAEDYLASDEGCEHSLREAAEDAERDREYQMEARHA